MRYASLGWFVLPIQGKRPSPELGDRWQDKSSANQATIARMFATVGHDGVGVHLGLKSDLIDFDCDSPEAEQTLEWLFDGQIPKTPSFKSARGRHVFFRYTTALPKPDSITFSIDGLEIRTGSGDKGAQTVVPPSGVRSWIVDPDDAPVAELPTEIIRRICDRFEATHKPKQIQPQSWSGESSGPLDVPKWLSSRGREIVGRTDGSDGVTRWHIECPNMDAHTTANNWRDCCVTQDAAGRLGGCCFHSSCGMNDWQTLKITIGEPGWSDYNDSEPINQPAVQAVMNSFDAPPPKKIVGIPAEIFQVGGIIGHLIEHNKATSLGPMKELALAGAISLMSVITGHKVRDFRNLRTNTYVISLAPSGSGKDDARKANKNILRQLRRPELLAPTKIKSSAGIVSALIKQNPSLFQLDELSGVLRTMRDPERNPYMADVITVLLEAWSESTGVYEPGAYADSKKNPIINQPHLCVYGTAVENEFWGSLTKRNLSDGLVGRLLVFEHIGYPADANGGDVEEFNPNLLSSVEAWLNFFPPGSGNLGPAPMLVQHTDEAIDRYIEHKRAINSRSGETAVRAALWRRCNEKAGKLALISACSRSHPNAVRIELQDVNWGIRLANWLTKNMLDRSQFKIADSPHEENLNKILNLIQDWTRREIIGQKIRSIRADERERIVRHAVLDGLIETREVETSGRKAIEYRAKNEVDL